MAQKQVVVVGLGRFGSSVTRTLYQMGYDVLALDWDERLVQNAMGNSTYAVKADATSESVLRELGVHNFDGSVVAIGSNIEASIMATVLVKSFEIPYIVARASNPLHGQTLERVGANRVIYPEQQMGSRVARNLFNPDVMEYMELSSDFGISKVRAPEEIDGRTLKEVGLVGSRDRYGFSVLAIRRSKDLVFLPAEEERLKTGDVLIVASRDDQLEKIKPTNLVKSITG
ncbi:TrkA family potassium uptake protein [SAR202 cluster bacterium AD-802-E10_MRT_200m]|nr:TrkA family potassium uptake protein [SAR202 cluster bacterium AD-802-E10_MRT_200m]